MAWPTVWLLLFLCILFKISFVHGIPESDSIHWILVFSATVLMRHAFFPWHCYLRALAWREMICRNNNAHQASNCLARSGQRSCIVRSRSESVYKHKRYRITQLNYLKFDDNYVEYVWINFGFNAPSTTLPNLGHFLMVQKAPRVVCFYTSSSVLC